MASSSSEARGVYPFLAVPAVKPDPSIVVVATVVPSVCLLLLLLLRHQMARQYRLRQFYTMKDGKLIDCKLPAGKLKTHLFLSHHSLLNALPCLRTAPICPPSGFWGSGRRYAPQSPG